MGMNGGTGPDAGLVEELGRAARLGPGSLYAGIGSRQTPAPALEAMRAAARELASRGAVLRSGGAIGADSAFAAGCREAGGQAEIMLPWSGYQALRFGPLGGGMAAPRPEPKAWDEAEAIAASLHPAWHRCTQGVRKLHSRNVFILLGADLASPVAAVACWMDPQRHGGTGMGVSVAKERGIPVVNMVRAG